MLLKILKTNNYQRQNIDTTLRRLRDLINKEFNNGQNLNDFIIWIKHDAS